MNARSALKAFAVLFCLLAVSNLLKPLQLSGEVGFVLFGQRLAGTANTIAGPLFGIYLAVYAYGIWTKRRFAVGMGAAYAIYVVINLVLWQFRMPEGAEASLAFSLVYSVVAIGVSSGSAFLLMQSREELT